ncbi:MAG: SMC family ATPase [Microlunatus sp.]
MRPLRLDIAGFAAFRDPVTVDFTDADYFALTGPTGSGKSTVIDAMTFALYGSAPRWGRADTIQYALAPTANRCTIRLVFDVAGQRYVVAREVRRSGKTPTQKNPRLERYLDPAATGDPDADEPTESLAADTRSMKQQIGELLGLDFEDFCTCVVLPQGDFATFLKASVAERQTILLKLLGARHYEAIGRMANQRAAAANARIDALQGQLAGYADATEEAEAAARSRQQQLVELSATVSSEVAELLNALTSRAKTAATIDRLTTQLNLLTAIEMPADIEALQGILTAAEDAYAAADQAEQESRAALSDAEEELSAGPQRAPLEETLRWHADRARESARLPEVVRAAEHAAAALAEAQQLAGRTDRELELARTAHEQCRLRADQSTAAVTTVERQIAVLASVEIPAGTAELGQATAAARNAAEQAAQQVELAEAAAVAAAEAVAAVPERSAIAALHRAVETYDGVLGQRADLDQRLEKTAAELQTAEELATEARDDLARAEAELEQLRTRSAAAELRPQLVAGHACPVCDQTVATLPPVLSVPALDAARVAVAAATQRHDAAAKTEETLRHRRAGLVAQDQALAARLTDLEQTLIAELSDSTVARATAGSDNWAAAVAALRANYDEAQRGQQVALRERETARRVARDARLALDQLVEQARESWAGLHAKHGQLSQLDPPPISDANLAEAWTRLAEWAAAHREQLATGELVTARQAQQSAEADLQTAAEELRRASAAARTAAEQHRTAAISDHSARNEHSRLEARLTELEKLLADRPTEADAERALAEHHRLSAAAGEARSRTQTAAIARQRAEAEREFRRTERDAARSALHRAREPLVPLGAPPVDDTDLNAAWTALRDWARAQAEDHEQALADQRAEATAADDEFGARLSRLSDRLRDRDLAIAVPTLEQLDRTNGSALLQRIPTEVELAAERAGHTAETISRRRIEAADLRSSIAADTETEQVARQLGRMMSAKQFPQWLADAALDTLVADASASLLALSSGQFELTHEKGEFFVIDHTDADSARSVKTLSGGETFQASLALALALSEQLSTLAAGGRTTLDSIFLDEGFGTLDPDALEVVASTLENLAQGKRVVGVVTHVAALAERVPVRYLVSRDSRTSTIERVGTIERVST